MAGWFVTAGSRVLAELGQTAGKDESAVAHTCFAEARRAVAVCFGFGEEFLEHRRVVHLLVFAAGFAVGAVVSPLASGLVQLIRAVLATLRRCGRPRRSNPVDFYEAEGGWRTLDVGPARAASSDGGSHRRSRFASAR